MAAQIASRLVMLAYLGVYACAHTTRGTFCKHTLLRQPVWLSFFEDPRSKCT